MAAHENVSKKNDPTTIKGFSTLIFSISGAGQASCDCGVPIEAIGSDRLAAGNAQAKGPCRDALQGLVNSFDLGASPRSLRLGHGLDLHGIHARQTPHTLLVELDGRTVVPVRAVDGGQFVAAILEANPRGLDVHIEYHRLLSH